MKQGKTVGTNDFVIMHFAECGLDWPCHDVRSQNHSLYTQENVLYSYGHHYPMARWLGRNTLLVNSTDSTPTTMRHKSDLIRWVGYHQNQNTNTVFLQVFFVPDVLTRTTDAHVSNMDDYTARLQALGGRVLRAREQRNWLKNRLSEMLCNRNDYSHWLRKYGVLANTSKNKKARNPMCLRECFMNVRSK